MNDLWKSKSLLEMKPEEILKFAQAGRSIEKYAMYLAASWDIEFQEVLKELIKYRSSGEKPSGVLYEAILEDARLEYYF